MIHTDNAVCSDSVAVLATPGISFCVPPQDEAFFASAIPFGVQVEIRRLLQICRSIDKAANVTKVCRALAAQYSQYGRGYSFSSLRTKYYCYVKSGGDWRSLWNKAKAPVTSDADRLPLDFISFVRKLAEDNQRKFAPAHCELLHIWRTHFDLKRKEYSSIPGYRDWPQPADGSDLPAGWSYANLSRKLGDAYTTTAARIGRSAAHGLALKVYSSRVGLTLGEYLQFDDHEFNLKINFPGQRRAMRPKGFMVMDVLSACCFSQGFKPTRWDEAEQKKRVLTEKDFMWFVVNVLTGTGYRTDERGTALIVEWGTAAIRDEFEQRIHDATRGHVRVERSGKFGAAAHIGQAEGRSHGNFRFKALIESWFNLLDNTLASQPGQVGKDRNHSPEQLHGLERENNKLLEAERCLQAADFSQSATRNPQSAIQFPFLSWPEFLDRATYLISQINQRTDHKLQGWAKLGFLAKEWRLNSTSDWLPESRLLELPPEEQRLALALIKQSEIGNPGARPAGPAMARSRQLSPQEVFNTRRAELHPLPRYKLPELLGPEFGQELTVRNGVFEFTDSEIDSDPLRYTAVDRHGQRLDGKYLCYVNPYAPDVLVACDDKNRVVAQCPARVAPSRNDIDGIKKQMGTARAWEANALAELNSRHIDTARENAARRSHNAGVMGRASSPSPRGEGRGEGNGTIRPASATDIPEEIDLRSEPVQPQVASDVSRITTESPLTEEIDLR